MPTNHKEVQTETISTVPSIVEQEVTVTLPMPPQPKPPPRSPKVKAHSDKIKVAEEKLDVRESLEVGCSDVTSELSSGESDETGSEDESVKYDTIKKSDYRRGRAEMPEPTICNGETELAESNPEICEKVKDEAKPKLDVQIDNSVAVEKVPTSDKEPEVITETKLSPSEEVVTTLVNQLVSDSVILTRETEEQPVEAEMASSSAKPGGGKQKGKRQSSKGSPKKGAGKK